jgi:hypothetical protein
MWPFNSNEKKTEEVTQDLSPNVQEFFKEANPEKNHQSIFEESPQQKQVNKVLAREEKWVKEQNHYDYKFERYKQTEGPNKVAQINCAELQQKVIECFRNWSLTSADQCRAEIGIVTKCADLQNHALKKLYYEDCYNIPQCDYIRYVADKLFTENFGQFGEDISDESKTKFNKDLDKAFKKVWK